MEHIKNELRAREYCHIDADCSAIKTCGIIFFLQHRFSNRSDGIKEIQGSLSKYVPHILKSALWQRAPLQNFKICLCYLCRRFKPTSILCCPGGPWNPDY